MARVRQALHCRAHRTNGEPCHGWAIVGGTVCRAHGGAARQVRYAAYVNETERRILREFNLMYERWLRELREWQVQRILTTACLLGMDPLKVTTMDIVLCHVQYGRPPLEDQAPKMGRDRRFKVPGPPTRRRPSTETPRRPLSTMATQAMATPAPYRPS